MQRRRSSARGTGVGGGATSLNERDIHSLTQQIDEALQVTGPDESASDAAGVSRRRLAEGHGSRPAKRRPILVIQSDPFNVSRLSTTVAAVITSNTGLAAMPGNVLLPAAASGLPHDSVVNVTALMTLDKTG